MKELRTPCITAAVVLFVLLLVSVHGVRIGEGAEGLLKVSFFNVGQGDAVLIESPTGTQILIDGGKGSSVLRELQKTMGFFDRDIDMVVATHPDADHIGGLTQVFERYDVGTVLLTENIADTPVFETFQQKISEEGAQIIYARRGQVFDLGNGEQGSTTLTILFPDHDPRELESNTSSIIAQLVYGESEYLFTGDSPQEIEEYLVTLGAGTLVSDVLKVGHHGSRTSSSEIFVRAVSPLYAIISAGEDNSYGHPHREVTDLLTDYDIIQKSTADEGTINSFSDGVKVFFE